MNQRAVTELREMKHLPKYQPTSLTMEEYQRDMDMVFHCSGELGPEALRYFDANGLILGAGDHLMLLFSENGDHAGVDYRWISDRYRLILKLLSWAFEGKYRYYAAETDGRLMVLVCFPWHYDNGLEQQAAGDELEALCREVIDRAGEDYELSVSAYISQFCGTPQEIASTCQQVKIHMEYQKFLRQDAGVWRVALSGKPLIEVAQIVKFAEKTAQQVLEKIYAGDSDFSEEIHEVMELLTEHPPYDVSVLLGNFQRIVSSCYDHFLEHRLFSVNELGEECLAENYLYYTEELRSAEDVERRLEDFFTFAYGQHHRDKVPWEDAVDRVQEYLFEHYRRPELSVAEIAESVGQKTSTMCSAYKRKKGVTVFETILQLRLNEAERLMEDPGLNLRDICEHCGFGSIESMYRAFKKRYGMSPGAFRSSKRRMIL